MHSVYMCVYMFMGGVGAYGMYTLKRVHEVYTWCINTSVGPEVQGGWTQVLLRAI